jgi:hypothetical protein
MAKNSGTTRANLRRDREAMSANERDTNTGVMPGLDPGIHQSSQRASFSKKDGLPGQARQRRFDGKAATPSMIH